VNPTTSSQLYDCVSAQIVAAEIRLWKAQLSDPKFRSFLIALYQIALAEDEDL
jgi:hypothetical protein